MRHSMAAYASSSVTHLVKINSAALAGAGAGAATGGLVGLLVGSGIPDEVKTPVVYLMGVVLMMVGVRQSYAKNTAEAELIKQYEFMYQPKPAPKLEIGLSRLRPTTTWM